MKKTDWNDYYESSDTNFVSNKTRNFTSKLIADLINKYSQKENINIIEFGGGNSCISEQVVQRCHIRSYTVVDNCSVGNQLFLRKKLGVPSSAIEADLLNEFKPKDESDICVSIGLIEHFDRLETNKVISSHFSSVRSGGLVIITFPTPTKLYRISRRILESTDNWSFWDERPLEMEEVINEVIKYGALKEKGIHWKIVLTQGYVVVEKY